MSDREGAIPLSRIRARLARPRGAKQVEALISCDDAAGAVAELGTIELYQLIREVGFADSYELVELATPDQLRGCLDLDVWDRDQLQVEALKPWFSALIEAGFEKLGQTWSKLDSELTALTLARLVHVYDLSLEEEVPDDEDRPLYNTPDTFFAVAIKAHDEETVVLVRRLLDDLYKADMVLARHTLMTARSESLAEMEEMSYRWRSGRMADLGYADYYQALEVFRPIDAASVVVGEGTEGRLATVDQENARELPVPIAEHVLGRTFLARALEEVGAADESREDSHEDDGKTGASARDLEAAFVVLTNQVLSALRISPGDDEGVRFGGDYAIGAVALGLELVSRGELDRATRALQTVSLTRLHRLGYTATLRLARLARALAPRSASAGEPTASVLEALLAQRPMFAGELDSPSVAVPRPFDSVADIRVVAEHLTRLALRVAIAEGVGANLIEAAAADIPGPEIDDYIRTALVRAMLGGELATTPLSRIELTQFRGDCLKDGSLHAAAREAAGAAVFALLERESIDGGQTLAPSLIADWLRELDQTFASLADGEEPDPRFLSNLITDVDRA